VYAVYGALGFSLVRLGRPRRRPLLSLALIAARLGYGPQLRVRLGATDPDAALHDHDLRRDGPRYHPTLIPANVVLDGLGSRQAGYFYIAFQVASIMSGVGVLDRRFPPLAKGPKDTPVSTR